MLPRFLEHRPVNASRFDERMMSLRTTRGWPTALEPLGHPSEQGYLTYVAAIFTGLPPKALLHSRGLFAIVFKRSSLTV